MPRMLKLREELPRILSLLYLIARGLVAPQDVDDLVQDTIVNILLQNPEIEPVNTKGYLAMCLYSARADWYVRATRHKRNAETVQIDDYPDLDQYNTIPAIQLICVGLNETIANLNRLPQLYADAIRIGIDADSDAEIGRIMNKPPRTVRNWLKNGRAILRDPDILGAYRGPRG